MRIIDPSVELINAPEYSSLLNTIETAGRICYKSEDRISDTSAEKFIENIINNGHEAVLEHGVFTVKFVCDRGVTHELVRHRMASYCQESTRYCNYSKEKFGNEITVIRPYFWTSVHRDNFKMLQWQAACEASETAYFELLHQGASPQEARAVLPNSLKTEIIMTANIREWRHFLKLRTSNKAHPQMRQIAIMLARIITEKYPVFFREFKELKA